MTSSHDLAAETYSLIEQNVEAIGKSLTAQIRRTVPNYAQIDLDAHTRDVTGTLRMMGPVFRGEEPTELFQTFGELVRIRIIEGILICDFVAANLCLLPTLRAFLARNVDDRQKASRMYGEVERVMIPFLGRCARIYAFAHDDQTGTLDEDAISSHWHASTIAYELQEHQIS